MVSAWGGVGLAAREVVGKRWPGFVWSCGLQEERLENVKMTHFGRVGMTGALRERARTDWEASVSRKCKDD